MQHEERFENPLRTWSADELAELFESLDIELGQGIRLLRMERGWSQRHLSEEIARLTGITLDSSAITRIEAGQRSVSLRQAMAVAVALDAASAESLVSRLGDRREGIDMAEWAIELRQSLRDVEAEADWKQRQAAGYRAQLDGVLDMLSESERKRFDEADGDG